jgi:3-deoxy-D-manno-octulosonic-acid transferase
VKSLADNSGFQAGRVSLMNADALSVKEVFILDTVGELAGFYSAADIVFVGGSLVKRGGQNILEPSRASKPVIFGQYMFNFRDIAQLFLENKAAIEIFDRDGLVAAVSSLLDNNLKAERLVKNARELISNNQGATKKNIKLIGKFIEGSAYGY